MAKNPFDDDTDDSAKAADKAAVETVKEKAKAAEPDAEIEIDLSKAEEELEDSEPQRESRESRLERKRNRYREQQEARASAERERDEARRDAAQMRELLLQAQRQAAPQPQPSKPEKDQLEEEMEAAFREQDMIYRDYNARAASLTPQEHEDYAKRIRDLQRKIVVTGGRIAYRDAGGGKQPDPRQIEAMVTAKRLKDEHNDVMSHNQRRAYMDGVWRQLIAEGRPDDWDTINEAADRTRKRFGLRTKYQAPPTESYKRKLTGQSRGGGSSSDEPRVVSMNAAHRSMANAAFRHIKDEGERFKRWAAGPGKRLLEKGR